MSIQTTPHRFTRAPNGIIAGVCQGVADSFGIDVLMVRIAWILSFFIAGFGGLLYIGLALTLPRKDKLEKAYEDKVLGVCARLAIRTDLEVGVVRFFSLILLCLSLGGTALAYLALYFVLPLNKNGSSKNVNTVSPV